MRWYRPLEGQASDLTVVVRREDRNDEGAATP